jgi:hypothetical protein
LGRSRPARGGVVERGAVAERDQHVEGAAAVRAGVARVVGHGPAHPLPLGQLDERAGQRLLAAPGVVELHLDGEVRRAAPGAAPRAERLAPLGEQARGLGGAAAAQERGEPAARRAGEEGEAGGALGDVGPAHVRAPARRRARGPAGVLARPVGQAPGAGARDEGGEVPVALGRAGEQGERAAVDHDLHADRGADVVAPAGEGEAHDAPEVGGVR